jgi:hypothetical protein
MAQFTRISSETKPITQALAAEFNGMTPSPTERDLSPGRVEHLDAKMKAGHVLSFHRATAKLGDTVYRMNGQHSSDMLVALNGAFPENAVAHIDHYEVDSIDGLALLFRQFDDRKSSRAPLDISGAYQCLHPTLRDLPRSYAKLAVESINWYNGQIAKINGEGHATDVALKGDEVYTLFSAEKHHDFIIFIAKMLSIKTPEMLRKDVIGAIYATYLKAKDTDNEEIVEWVKEFWRSVAVGDTGAMEEDDPAMVLDQWLTAAKNKQFANPPASLHYYIACVLAFNAARDGKGLPKGLTPSRVKKVPVATL